jgi:hypothetical protein
MDTIFLFLFHRRKEQFECDFFDRFERDRFSFLRVIAGISSLATFTNLIIKYLNNEPPEGSGPGLKKRVSLEAMGKTALISQAS